MTLYPFLTSVILKSIFQDNIYLCGKAEDAVGSKAFVAAMNQDGELIPSFGSNGLVTNQASGCSSIEADNNGDLYVGSEIFHSGTLKITKLLANGDLNPSFGIDGHLLIAVSRKLARLIDLVRVNERRMLVQYLAKHNDVDPAEVGVVAIDLSGGIDTSYGQQGYVRIPVGTDFNPTYHEAMVDLKQRLLFGFRFGKHKDIAIVRLLSHGEIDATFGNNGFVIVDR